jgi:hypothetical protein
MEAAMRLVFSFIVMCGVAAPAAAAPFALSEPHGPYAVGLRVVQQYDRSRSFRGDFDLTTGEPLQGERSRPLQTLVWYPARPDARGAAAPLRYRDYLALEATEDAFGLTAAGIAAATEARIAASYAASPTPADAARELAAPLAARRDAPPLADKFPVVIYAPSLNGTAHENADLCEYLASRGYVVVASSSRGPRARQMSNDLAGVEAQAADIAFLTA